jgi:hypothetical protein
MTADAWLVMKESKQVAVLSGSLLTFGAAWFYAGRTAVRAAIRASHPPPVQALEEAREALEAEQAKGVRLEVELAEARQRLERMEELDRELQKYRWVQKYITVLHWGCARACDAELQAWVHGRPCCFVFAIRVSAKRLCDTELFVQSERFFAGA